MAMEHEARSERETLSPGMRVLIRGQEWLVDKVEPNSLGNHAVSCTGISALVRDMTATFLDDLDTITPVDPVKTRFIPDTSARAAKSHLFIESLLRATAPTDTKIHVGNKAAMDSLPYQSFRQRRRSPNRASEFSSPTPSVLARPWRLAS